MTKTNSTRHIRVQLGADQHLAVRIAAAATNRSMAEFAREATLSAASEAMKNFTPPQVPSRPHAPEPRPH